MMIHFQTGEYEYRFFDRFDEESRRFEDLLRSESMLVDSIPWPRISFWQGYRHLQSISKKYFVLQMIHRDSKRAYQMAVVEEASRIPFFKTGACPYWIPRAEPDALPAAQADLLKTLRELCLKHTALMSLRVHCYIPGEAALNAAENLLRDSGFEACDRQAPATTRFIDLRPPIEEILSQFPTKTRTKLKLKKPDEVRVEELKRREQIPDLQAALNDSFGRSTARQYFYDFGSLFDTLEKSPETAAAFGFFLSDDWTSPQAFITGFASPPLFEYAIAGSRSNARLRQFKFNYILLWRLVEAAKASGAQLFDMGGITPGDADDPLAGISDFKRRFPGFETSVGRERILALRPARRRLFSTLQAMKGFFAGTASRAMKIPKMLRCDSAHFDASRLPVTSMSARLRRCR